MAVLVEGQSEEAFIKQLLQAYVFDQQDSWLTPVVVETSRAASGQKRKGGGSWSHYLADIRKLLGSRHYAVVTTLIDFYGYPHDGPHAQCETAHGARACAREKARGMAAAVSSNRFLPFVLLHEFETLVLASSINRRTVLGDANAALCLQSHCAQVSNDVELLNTAFHPSARVKDCVDRYDKVTDGVAAISEVGIQAVANYCPGFAAWLGRL